MNNKNIVLFIDILSKYLIILTRYYTILNIKNSIIISYFFELNGENQQFIRIKINKKKINDDYDIKGLLKYWIWTIWITLYKAICIHRWIGYDQLQRK